MGTDRQQTAQANEDLWLQVKACGAVPSKLGGAFMLETVATARDFKPQMAACKREEEPGAEGGAEEEMDAVVA
jgi:hypothetical protein